MADASWQDAALIILVGILLSGWISSQFTQIAGRGEEAGIATNYQTMGIVALVFFIAAAANVAFFRYEGIGDLKNALPFLLVGGVVGTIITAGFKLQFARLLSGTGSIDPSLSFAFIIVLAPIIEEQFFRGALYPSIKVFLMGRGMQPTTAVVVAALIAAAAVSFFFAVWHVQAVGADSARLVGEFLFSLLQIALLETTGGLAAPIASHFMRNLLTGG